VDRGGRDPRAPDDQECAARLCQSKRLPVGCLSSRSVWSGIGAPHLAIVAALCIPIRFWLRSILESNKSGTRGCNLWFFLIKHPLVVFVLSFFLLWLSAKIGLFIRKRQLKLQKDVHQDLDIIVSATLTLLGLIIGFSFSMAISRYDQRKNYEEAEANAIGTEYLRADLLPTSDRSNVRTLLRSYLDQRILFYETRDENALLQIDATTAQLQTDLWSAVGAPAGAQPTPVLALAV
jgi:hypothetical protein